MTDLDRLILILETLKIEYADYYRPDGRADVHIYDQDMKLVGSMWFDADGNFKSCDGW